MINNNTTNDDQVLAFIKQRFPNAAESDSNWLHGNCYYFSVILRDRFATKDPTIYYDVIHGHFLTKINDNLYDAKGIAYKLSVSELDKINKTQLWHPVELDYDIVIVNWQYFSKYDSLQYERINRDCID